MSIPNVSTLYKRIKQGREGGSEFARIMNMLMIAESKDCSFEYIDYSDEAGDYKGVDAIVKDNIHGKVKGFQYKFYPQNLSSNNKSSITKSLESALDKFPELEEWILVTPEDFLKFDLKWFQKLKNKYEIKLISFEIDEQLLSRNKNDKIRKRLKIEHWGHTRIIELMLKHQHIGLNYYPEIYNSFNDRLSKFKLAKVSVDTLNCNWARSISIDNKFYQYDEENKRNNKTSNLIFDFIFINNENKVFLLERIDLIIEKLWTKLKGFPSERLLKSVATIKMNIDFNKKINSKNFFDPIIFYPLRAERFKIQLEEFAEKCPHNCAKIKFRFCFVDFNIESESIILSF